MVRAMSRYPTMPDRPFLKRSPPLRRPPPPPSGTPPVWPPEPLAEREWPHPALRARALADVTQDTLAALAGVHPGTVSRFERALRARGTLPDWTTWRMVRAYSAALKLAPVECFPELAESPKGSVTFNPQDGPEV